MTSWSSIQAMTLADPPQRLQTSMSILNTRFRRWAQVMAAWRSAGVWTSALAIDLTPFPRLAGVTSPRQRWFGLPPAAVGQEPDGRGIRHCANDCLVYLWRDRCANLWRSTNSRPDAQLHVLGLTQQRRNGAVALHRQDHDESDV